jgi:hypothetical protein
VQWADDNTHVLVEHVFDGKTEYLLIDRTDPSQSLNLNNTLGVTPTSLQLLNLKYDQYVLYDQSKELLSKATLSQPTPVSYIDHVLSFKTYSNDTVLYAASGATPTDKVNIDIRQGDDTYTIRQAPPNTTYLLDITKYANNTYAAISASSEGSAFVYKNPVQSITNPNFARAIPAQTFRISNPNYVSFSSNTQFVTFESGTQFSTYDALNMQGFSFSLNAPLDTPQQHATWMDGDRLTYVSNGSLIITDYDGKNKQTLQAADGRYIPAFSPDFRYVYTLNQPVTTATRESLDSTALRTSADL